jgi:hypothetical protein
MIGMEGWKDGDGLVARFREGGVCFDPRRQLSCVIQTATRSATPRYLSAYGYLS